jgi:hypothetical protein
MPASPAVTAGKLMSISMKPASSTLSVRKPVQPSIGFARCFSATSLGFNQKHLRLSPSLGNLHCIKSSDYSNVSWPLPKMFGPEKYAYALIDISDPRYVREAAGMGRRLFRLFYDLQIIDLEWRVTYRRLTEWEYKKTSLPASAAQKAREKVEQNITASKARLLELQEQKDLYNECVQQLWDRCDFIKAELKKEEQLEALRQEMTAKIRDRIDANDAFWSKKFNFHSNAAAKAAAAAASKEAALKASAKVVPGVGIGGNKSGKLAAPGQK